MPVSDENLPLYIALQGKRDALFDYLMQLHNSKTPGNEFYVNIEIGKVRLEQERVHAILSDLDNNRPVNFPSQQQFAELQASVAALGDAVARSAALEAVMAAGSAVLAAWPVSGGG